MDMVIFDSVDGTNRHIVLHTVWIQFPKVCTCSTDATTRLAAIVVIYSLVPMQTTWPIKC